MLIKLGRGFGCGQQYIATDGGGEGEGGGAPATYSNFEINLGPTNNWQALVGMFMYDADDNEFFTALTPVGESVSNMAGLSAGEYTTNSDYGQPDTSSALIDANPNPDVFNSPVGVFEWSSTSSLPLIVFVKPSAPISISKIELCATVNYGWSPTHAFFEADGSALTPASAPADGDDYYQTTQVAHFRWYRWTF